MLCVWLLNLRHKMNIMQMKKLRKVFQRSPAVNLNYIITEDIHNYIASYSNPRLLPHHILTQHIRFPPPHTIIIRHIFEYHVISYDFFVGEENVIKE